MILTLFRRLAHARPLAVLTLLYLLFPAVILPAAEARIKGYSGGVGVIDLKFGYTPAEVFDMVAAYGEQGRAFYRLVEMTADVLYPLAYTLFFGALLSAILPRAFPKSAAAPRLALLPALAFSMDMLENVGIVTMLTQFPAQTVWVAQVTNLFTLAKWISFGGIIVTLVVGLIVWMVGRFARQPTGRPA